MRKGNLSLLLDMAFCGCETTADLKPKKMDWPTQQPFLQQVCSFVYSVTICWQKANHVSFSHSGGLLAENSHGLATRLRNTRTSNWRHWQPLRLHCGFEVHRCGVWLDRPRWRLLER